LLRKIVWKTWSSSGFSLSSWYWNAEQSKHISCWRQLMCGDEGDVASGMKEGRGKQQHV
jgi:hypothetical protein